MARPSKKKLNALIIDADPNSRSRLKQALHHEEKAGLLRFQKIYTSQALGEALTILKKDNTYDLILISQRLGNTEIADFLEEARETRMDEYAFVIVTPSNVQEQRAIANGLISGIHGMLCSPFSVENLREVVQITEQVLQQNLKNRMKRTVPLVMDLMLKEIDEKARRLRCEEGTKPLSEKSKKLMNNLSQRIGDGAQELQVDALADGTEKARPFNPRYMGPSGALKRRTVAQEKKELKKEGMKTSEEILKKHR